MREHATASCWVLNSPKTNQSLYQITGQVTIRETICKRQLMLTGHCIRMSADEPANQFFIYDSTSRSTKDDLSQSNFVAHSTIWRESKNNIKYVYMIKNFDYIFNYLKINLYQ